LSRTLLAVSTVALIALLAASGAGAVRTSQALPPVGILTPGVSLGGLQLGDTQAQVIKRWGNAYALCPDSQCKGADVVWLFVYSHGEPLSGAVRFSKLGRVVAVFTLGSPAGWKTHEGLQIGQAVDDAYRIYGQNLAWSACVGYGAISMRNARAVTSIYTTGDNIYGFAITAPGTPICQ
jgi:hypothetical protein